MFETLTQAKKEIEPKLFRSIHQAAVLAVTELKQKEALLVLALQDVDENFVYRYLGFNSLFRYCVDALKLTEAQSYMYISVSRKSKNLPALREALASGEVTVSKASRVISVIDSNNAQYWLDLTKESTKHEVEKEVAKVNPKAICPERARYLTDTTIELQVAVSEEVFKLLKRAQEILAQKHKKPISLEGVIKTLSENYLEKQDPLKREKRRQVRKTFNPGATTERDSRNGDKFLPKVSFQSPIVKATELCPGRVSQSDQTLALGRAKSQSLKQTTKDHILARDEGRCTYRQGNRRCTERVYLHVHHIQPKELGGTDDSQNLTTLCSGHHRAIHGEYH